MRRPGSMPCIDQYGRGRKTITPGSVQPGMAMRHTFGRGDQPWRGERPWPPWPATSTRKPLATDQTRQPKRSVIADCARGATHRPSRRPRRAQRWPAAGAVDCRLQRRPVEQQHDTPCREVKARPGTPPARRRSRSDRTRDSLGLAGHGGNRAPPRPAPW
jgi:hypothetical protein